MAITTQFLTGFEHGLASVAGAGLFDLPDQSHLGTIVTTNARSGVYCGNCVPAAANTEINCFHTLVFGGADRTVTRFAMRVNTLPSGNGAEVFDFLAGSGRYLRLTLDTDGTAKLTASAGGASVTGGILPLNQWVCIEINALTNATTWSADWKINGTPQPTLSAGTQLAASVTQATVGLPSSAAAFTYDISFDDWIVGNGATATDWYGDGKVLSYLPGSDGTHSIAGSQFSFGEAGTAFSSTSTAWTMVDDAPPWTTTRSTTDNLGQRITGTANYLEIAPVSPAASSVAANAVRALLAYSSVSTTANTAGADVRNSAGAVSALLGASGAPVAWNVSSNNFKGAIVTAPAAGWTPAEVAAIRWRFGYSNDINPVPTCQALMLEVDWPVSAAAASLVFASRTARNSLLRR